MPTDGLTTIPVGAIIAASLSWLVLAVFFIVVLWKVFTKAGQPGWAAIIPIYNTYVLCKIAGRSGWWVVLLIIPVVDVVILLILCLDIAKAFGKSGAFGFFGLFLFSIIGYPILAFGDARYQGQGSYGGGNGQYGGYPGGGYPNGGYPAAPSYPAAQGYPPAPGYPPPPNNQGYPQQPQPGYPPQRRGY